MPLPLIIGLTGGIGAGKTTVSEYFALLNVPVYNSDERAKVLMDENDSIKNVLLSEFGEKVYKNNRLNRPYLASIIFSNPEKLTFVNSIIHPAVHLDFKNWVTANANVIYVVKEAAILFETEGNKNCDKVILVTAPFEERIKRVTLRDNSSEEQIKQRIATQWSDEKKIELADYIIENKNLEKLEGKVLKIHHLICQKTHFLKH